MPSTRERRLDTAIVCNDHSQSSVFTGTFASTTLSRD
jgi:hypothetical protein